VCAVELIRLHQPLEFFAGDSVYYHQIWHALFSAHIYPSRLSGHSAQPLKEHFVPMKRASWGRGGSGESMHAPTRRKIF